MSAYESYIFSLCAIVFVSLVTVFSFLITLLVRMQITLIRCGQEDESIIKKYLNPKKCPLWLERVVSIIMALILIALLITTIYVNAEDEPISESIPDLRVVQSSSMAHKRESNKYLFENELDDQIQMFDIIRIYSAPAEFELELYDIVVYEIKGAYVVHRIVGIEEPNKSHPDSRLFKLQGDAVAYPDTEPVEYSQIRGIYRGERTSNVGSFVMFMKTPAGWLCFMLVIAYIIIDPLVTRRLKKEEDARYALLSDDNNGDNNSKDGDADEMVGASVGE